MDVCNSSIQHINDMNNNFMAGVKDTLKTLTTKLVETINKLTIENNEAMELNNGLKAQVTSLEARLQDMTKELENSLEEQRQLLKVSRVVAIEKDNARLRTELQQLETKFQLLKEQHASMKAPCATTNVEKVTTVITNEHVDIHQDKEQEQSQEEALNVREKKIKGAVYYVSDDNSVYTKNDDDSIGNIIGRIEGKKVKWL
jgi:predicted RNase H-like nuclease (RuvC/YqgF family)